MYLEGYHTTPVGYCSNAVSAASATSEVEAIDLMNFLYNVDIRFDHQESQSRPGAQFRYISRSTKFEVKLHQEGSFVTAADWYWLAARVFQW